MGNSLLAVRDINHIYIVVESSDKTSAEALPKDRSLCGRMRDTLWDPFHFQRKEIRSENPEKNPEKTLQDQRGRRDRVCPWDRKKKKPDPKIH